MASWVGALLGLTGLLIGVAVGSWATGIANSELAAHIWQLVQENERLKRALGVWEEN